MTLGSCGDYSNQADCEANGCYWYNGSCHSSSPSANDLNNQTDCERFGYFWYGSTCNSTPQTNTLVLLATEGGNPYAGGTEIDSDDSGSNWTVKTNDDVYFKEYGNKVAGAKPRDVYASGYTTRFQKRQMVGYFSYSGDLRSIEVNASGAIKTDVEVVASSGLQVTVSGQPVTISGDHVFVESGVYVINAAGIQISGTVKVSGDVSVISGDISVWANCSGGGTTPTRLESNSGILFVTNLKVPGNSIRTGNVVNVTAASGGQALALSGYWCSGAVHEIVIKNFSGNQDVYIGEANCKPYSGYGFPLSMGETVRLDYNNLINTRVCAAKSGEVVGYMGFGFGDWFTY